MHFNEVKFKQLIVVHLVDPNNVQYTHISHVKQRLKQSECQVLKINMQQLFDGWI